MNTTTGRARARRIIRARAALAAAHRDWRWANTVAALRDAERRAARAKRTLEREGVTP